MEKKTTQKSESDVDVLAVTLANTKAANLNTIITIVSVLLTIMLFIVPYAFEKSQIEEFYKNIELSPKTVDNIVVLLMFIVMLHLRKLNNKVMDANLTLKEVVSKQSIFIANSFSTYHSFAHKFRNCWYNYLKEVKSTARRSSEQINNEANRKIFELVVFYIKKQMREFLLLRGVEIKDDIRVSIKMAINKEDLLSLIEQGREFSKTSDEISKQDRWVVTAFRDHETYQLMPQPEVFKRIYEISDRNTDLEIIFNKKEPVFCCDDLVGLRDYRNENSDWRETYNSTIVMSVRTVDASKKQYKVYGILAVDSRNQKGDPLYENKDVAQIIGGYADLLAAYFNTMEALND